MSERTPLKLVGVHTLKAQVRFYKVFLVWVEALRPSQQFFSHVGMEPPLPGYYQYFFGRYMLLKDTTQ